MRRILIASFGILLFAGLLHAADALPTQADIQADFDAAKYQDCLKKIAQVINVSSKDTDRYTLFILKGECLLQTKVPSGAADAFGFASKNTKDKKDFAVAAATEILIKRSENFQYTPKTGDKTPLPIIDKAARPAALTALYKDELATAQATANNLQKSIALPPLIDFARSLGQLAILSTAAGADDAAATLRKDLATHAQTVIDNVLTADKATIERVRAYSNGTDVRERQISVDPKTGRQTWVRETIRRGVTNSDASVLSEIYGVCNKLPAVCNELSVALDTDFKGVITNAQGVVRLADEVSRIQSAVTKTETFYR